MAAWTAADMPDQTGRTVVVTGASSGIGLEAAEAFAAKGAQVVLAVRSQSRGDAVRARLAARHPRADLRVSLLDLADLGSVRAFAARLIAEARPLDVLLNNAGLGLQPARALTVDGFERQFGTNHLGHFALTGLLLPLLSGAPAPRVVTISSIAHRRGRIDFNDLQGARRYSGLKAYGQSKLANLIFAFELDRRARAAGFRLTSVAAHPGVARTGFVAGASQPPLREGLFHLFMRIVGQDAKTGALPGLYAASMPDVRSGQYWGSDGFFEFRGPPSLAAVSHQARDLVVASRLWSVSEELTGVTYRFGPTA